MSKEEQLKKEILKKVEAYYKLKFSNSEKFVPQETKINYAGRIFDEKELVNLVDSSLDFWLTYGRFSKEFEKRLAQYLGVNKALLVNSGSSANLLAFMALTSPILKDRKINRGDEVITVAAGFPTTVAPIIQYGAVPVFVDVDLKTFNVDVNSLKGAKTSKTKAVMLAHTLGNPFDIKAVKAFCDKYGLWLIEDNCDSLGSKYDGKLTGTFGDIGTSSFYPPHHITMGEGGAVYTNDSLLSKIMLSMRDWGRDCWCESGVDNTCKKRFSNQYGTLPFGYDHKYVYSHFGYNLKVSDMQAAIGCAQLEKVSGFVEKRRENFKKLYNGLKELEDYFILAKATEKSEPSWFGFWFTLKNGIGFNRNDIVQYLEKNNIQTRNLFAGNITCHPCFEHMKKGKDYKVSGTLKNTDKIMTDSFWVGVYPGITDEKLDYIVNKVTAFIKEKGK
ncbi:MAG: lipopolysaccharide biosynthesis protein RfbH [Candidatus Omnitrophica bacterium]|nr:lipopolysaccharide biosynthesis protein RfbH [Candidatus Omnitrophota bacterium]MDD5081316.1 lipopolysaccharide biosynthesis protein RfbH [Candidatus Omnitrophota bacterium]